MNATATADANEGAGNTINTDATNLALQVALLIPILAGLLGLFGASRMMCLPDIEPTAAAEAAAFG